MRIATLALALLLLTAGCDIGTGGASSEPDRRDNATPTGTGDPLAAHDPAKGTQAVSADDKPRPVMQLQVVLDRLGFTPGVVDGKTGLSTRNALAGFQEARDLSVSGTLDEATRTALAEWNNIPATRTVMIPPAFAAGPFITTPEKPADQAKLPALGYQSLDEKLAERFHTTPEVLWELNGITPPTNAQHPAGSTPPWTAFRAGQQVRVPNVGGDQVDRATVTDEAWLATLTTLGVGSSQPEGSKIVVSKSKGTLKVYNKAGTLVGMYTATMGSSHDPLPLGTWKVEGVAHNPDFAFNPELFWDAADSTARERLPPGPNGPVGVVWIDLNKEHYGIHGTPEPATIGRSASHGCVRLTNWDAARLAQMVKLGTQVIFEA